MADLLKVSQVIAQVEYDTTPQLKVSQVLAQIESNPISSIIVSQILAQVEWEYGIPPEESVFVVADSNWRHVVEMELAVDGNLNNIAEGWIVVNGEWKLFWPPPT